MSPNEAEQAAMARFKRERELAHAPVRMEIERRVGGSDYGGTSWTTVEDAGQVAELLRLGPGKLLLDIGAGSGWPGLYLARMTDCDVVLTDVPYFGLKAAAARAEADGLAGDCQVAVADGAALPFESARFDAVSHSDVLCCLAPKREALESCRRVARAGARTVFTVITIAPGLSPADHDRAIGGAPPFPDISEGYPEMLAGTGWEITDQIDLTAEFVASSRRMLEEEEAHADALVELHGADDFEARLDRRRSRVAVLDDGLLRRELFAATAVAIEPDQE